jgi:hypothetical protein
MSMQKFPIAAMSNGHQCGVNHGVSGGFGIYLGISTGLDLDFGV